MRSQGARMWRKLPVSICEWVTQFRMGFRQTIESFWVKSRSTTLWPLHRPGPSKIKGERGGKSVIKSETLSVNFPLCHYCAYTHTRMHVRSRTHTHTHTHTVDPHPSCTGGHDLMYQYWERNEAEDAWPLKAAADQLKLCVGFIGWRWCTCGADEGFKSKAFAFNKGWKWKLTACWWLYVWRHLVLCMNAECRDLFLTPRGIKRSFNANKISALEIVLQKNPKKNLLLWVHMFSFSHWLLHCLTGCTQHNKQAVSMFPVTVC